MSALIDMSNYRANMAYVGETPWHGLGQELNGDESIEQWKIAAGLNWKIESSSVVFRHTNEKGGVGTFPNQRVLWRSDTKEPLSIVSKNRYNIVQPGECLEFFSDIVGAGNDFQMHTAGSLDQGKRIWALAKHKDELNLVGDVVEPYILLATSCDGTMATVGTFTTVRVVCQNTLSMAERDAQIRVSHSREFDAQDMRNQLATISGQFESFKVNADILASKKMSNADAVKYWSTLFAETDGDGFVTNQRTLEQLIPQLGELFESGPGAELVSARHTAWGALNAVTRFVDHQGNARSNNNRFVSAQFGKGRDSKNKAMSLALEMAA